jgi:hypothetical protein
MTKKTDKRIYQRWKQNIQAISEEVFGNQREEECRELSNDGCSLG